MITSITSESTWNIKVELGDIKGNKTIMDGQKCIYTKCVIKQILSGHKNRK